MTKFRIGTALALVLAATGAQAQTARPTTRPSAPVATPAQADAFVADAAISEAAMALTVNRASWVNATYITDDTDALAAQIGAQATDLGVSHVTGAARFANTPACRRIPRASCT